LGQGGYLDRPGKKKKMIVLEGKHRQDRQLPGDIHQ
jgi:hypothetical protein